MRGLAQRSTHFLESQSLIDVTKKK